MLENFGRTESVGEGTQLDYYDTSRYRITAKK